MCSEMWREDELLSSLPLTSCLLLFKNESFLHVGDQWQKSSEHVPHTRRTPRCHHIDIVCHEAYIEIHTYPSPATYLSTFLGLFCSRGLTSASLPFHARADLWRHPPPYENLAIVCRKGADRRPAQNATKALSLSPRSLSDRKHGQGEASDGNAGLSAPQDKQDGDKEKEKQDEEEEEEKEKGKLLRSFWRTEASSAWGSSLPKEIHFPTRYYPTRREFTASLPMSKDQRRRSSNTSLCTSIRHSRVPMHLEPLGGI